MSLKKWKQGLTAQNEKNSGRLPCIAKRLDILSAKAKIEHKIDFT